MIRFWRCPTRPIPADVAQVNVYGLNQELISYDLFLGVIEHQIRMGFFDQTLNNQTWGTSSFNFTAGQLFEIFPLLAERYDAKDTVTGECQAAFSGLDFYALSQQTLVAKITYGCSLFVQRSRFSNLNIEVRYELQNTPWSSSIRLELKNYSHSVKFYPYADYKIKDLSRAQAIVTEELKKIKEVKIFRITYPYISFKSDAVIVTEKKFIRTCNRYQCSKEKVTEAKMPKKILKENLKEILTFDE